MMKPRIWLLLFMCLTSCPGQSQNCCPVQISCRIWSVSCECLGFILSLSPLHCSFLHLSISPCHHTVSSLWHEERSSVTFRRPQVRRQSNVLSTAGVTHADDDVCSQTSIHSFLMLAAGRSNVLEPQTHNPYPHSNTASLISQSQPARPFPLRLITNLKLGMQIQWVVFIISNFQLR